VSFIERFDPACYKVASASLTDHELLDRVLRTERPVMLSTGMSTMEEIHKAVAALGPDNLLIAHATSTYPCKPNELHLRMLATLRDEFDAPRWLLGSRGRAHNDRGGGRARRHLRRTAHHARPGDVGKRSSRAGRAPGLMRLVRDIRELEVAMGDGVKRVYESELPRRARLRRNA